MQQANIIFNVETAASLRDMAATLGLYIRRGPGSGEIGNIKTLLEQIAEAYEQDKGETIILLKRLLEKPSPLQITLEKFLSSPDFKTAVVEATKVSWGGFSSKVEILPDGTWLAQKADRFGNLYESSGVLLPLPTLDCDETSEYVENGGGSEEDFLSAQFDLFEQELKEEMYISLGDGNGR